MDNVRDNSLFKEMKSTMSCNMTSCRLI